MKVDLSKDLLKLSGGLTRARFRGCLLVVPNIDAGMEAQV